MKQIINFQRNQADTSLGQYRLRISTEEESEASREEKLRRARVYLDLKNKVKKDLKKGKFDDRHQGFNFCANEF